MIGISVIIEIWLIVLLRPLYLNIYRKIYYSVGAKMDAWGRGGCAHSRLALNKKYNLFFVLALLDLLFTVYLMITVFFYLVNHVAQVWIILDATFTALSIMFFFLGVDTVRL